MSGKTKSRRRGGRKTLLTDEIQEKIVAYIRAGAFDWVAARAAGIAQSTFYLWMKGDTPRRAQFRDAVEEARAQARLAAEVEVRKRNPEFWLSRGPGRERPGQPGWGEKTTHEIVGHDGGPIKSETIAKAQPVAPDQLADVLAVLTAAGLVPTGESKEGSGE